MNVPVIVSDAGGMKFGLMDGITGYVVPENDLEGFVQKIRDLIINVDRTELNFNHPCKELIWVYQTSTQQRGGGASTANPTQFTSLELDTANPGPSAILKLNGQDRFQERRMEYFRRVQGYKHHTHAVRADSAGVYKQWIYLYSFALNPEEHQPSGTCNFSRIDNTILSFNNLNSLGAGVVKIFAVNYNVLRIMSGMGGLAYSN